MKRSSPVTKTLSGILLWISAAILIFGGVMHARAFNGAQAAIAEANLPAFYASSLKALWMIDSATLLTLGIVFVVIAIRSFMMAGIVVSILALIPAATAGLIYYFVGPFLPAHLLITGAAMAFVAGLLRIKA
jgi:hypothetical protein